MNKLSNTVEKLKIKAKPNGYKKLKEICKKMQGIIDRRLANEAMKKVPSYTEELYFYSLFIPNLIPEMSIYHTSNETEKMKILKFKISVWTKANLNDCAKFISIFDEGRLTETLPGPKGGKRRSSKASSPRKSVNK